MAGTVILEDARRELIFDAYVWQGCDEILAWAFKHEKVNFWFIWIKSVQLLGGDSSMFAAIFRIIDRMSDSSLDKD